MESNCPSPGGPFRGGSVPGIPLRHAQGWRVQGVNKAVENKLLPAIAKKAVPIVFFLKAIADSIEAFDNYNNRVQQIMDNSKVGKGGGATCPN